MYRELEYTERVRERGKEQLGTVVGFHPREHIEVLWDDGTRTVVKEDQLRRAR